MEGLIFQSLIFIVLFSVGWAVGRHVEKKHLAELVEQERRLQHITMDTNKFAQSSYSGTLITSNVVISHDYFKFVLANIQNFFGGRLSSYETITERARREAIVRLKRQADKIGATHIMGVRLSTTELGMQGGMVEVFAYATAVKQRI